MEINLMEKLDVEAVALTESAAVAIQDLMAKRELQNHALRVFVSGGGCSGFQYGMALEENVRQQDFVFEQHGVKVVVDEVSIQYLKGATVDYVDEIMGSGFKIENPNAVASCGCGNSFRTAGEAGTEEGAGSCSCGHH